MKSSMVLKRLPHVRTLVVKVGSKILSSRESGGYQQRMNNLVEDIVTLKKAGTKVLLVSSGAIAHGVLALDLAKRPTTIPLKQACASIGQIRLMHQYEALFGASGVPIGQVLLTWDDLRDKKRYLNLRNTLFMLLEHNAVPIINENDSVGVEEIRFGDNDTLGAQIALLAHADLYINLTDTNGLYDANPKKNRHARQIPQVNKITADLFKVADRDGTAQGVGGMETKLKAAMMLTRAGIHAIVGDGFHRRLSEVLSDPLAGTLFMPEEKKMSSLHRWIAFAGHSRGRLIVDAGATFAVRERGKSLLPAGIRLVEGRFSQGDLVEVADEKHQIIAHGMVNYCSADLEKIKGQNSGQIPAILGTKTFDEAIHRDNLVVLKS